MTSLTVKRVRANSVVSKPGSREVIQNHAVGGHAIHGERSHHGRAFRPSCEGGGPPTVFTRRPPKMT
eukprot:1163929-Pyramimonas_sp.AAC.1